jgi:Peptidase family M23
MQKLTLIALTLLFTNISFGQKSKNEIFEASKGKWEVPLPKFTKIEYYKTLEHICDAHLDSTFKIFTDSSYRVKAMHTGEVLFTCQIDSGNYFVIVKYGNYYLTYSNLSKILVKKGHTLKKNESLGIVGKDLDGIFCLDIFFSKREKDICPKNWINWNTRLTTQNENKIFEDSKGKWAIPLVNYKTFSILENPNNARIDLGLILVADSACEVKALHDGK